MASARQHKLLQTGSPAPDFSLARLGGGTASLSDLTAGGPILLAFFKVTCPVCQFTFPFLDRIQAAGTLPIFGVSQNCPEDTMAFAREFKLGLPMLRDPEADEFPASNAFGISAVPTMFLIEKDGTISRVIEGWNKKEIEWLGAQAGVAAIHEDDNVPAWKAG